MKSGLSMSLSGEFGAGCEHENGHFVKNKWAIFFDSQGVMKRDDYITFLFGRKLESHFGDFLFENHCEQPSCCSVLFENKKGKSFNLVMPSSIGKSIKRLNTHMEMIWIIGDFSLFSLNFPLSAFSSITSPHFNLNILLQTIPKCYWTFKTQCHIKISSSLTFLIQAFGIKKRRTSGKDIYFLFHATRIYL